MDKEEFAQVVLDATDTMYRVSKSILRRDTDCEDAVSQAIVNAFEHLDSLKKPQYARTWLIRIAMNECFRISKSRKREQCYEDDVICIEEWNVSQDDIYQENDYQELYEALHLKREYIEPYTQEVKPEVRKTTEFVPGQEEQIFKENDGEELTFENPLWEISDAWYDGATLYFTANQSEEAKQLTDCEVSGHDHIRVNGRDALLSANPMDEFDYDYKLPYHGRYECKVDLTDVQVEGDLEVCIPLVIYRHDAVDPQSMSYAGKQEVTFTVRADSVEKVKKAPMEQDNRKSYDFDGGSVEVWEFSTAPSILKIRFKYTLDGPDAEEIHI